MRTTVLRPATPAARTRPTSAAHTKRALLSRHHIVAPSLCVADADDDLAVPFVAVMNTAIRSLLAESPEEVIHDLLTGEPRLYSAEPDKPDVSGGERPR